MNTSGWDWDNHDWRKWAPPFGRRGRFFEAGEVRLAVLSLLEERPRHGYELMKALEARSGGTYKVSAGTIYPTLQLLEDEGLILSETQDGRRVYRLTEEGRRELDRERETVDEIWRRAARWEDWSGVMNPEAYAMIGGPLGGLMKATFKAIKHSRGSKHVVEQVGEALEQAKAHIEAIEREFEAQRRAEQR